MTGARLFEYFVSDTRSIVRNFRRSWRVLWALTIIEPDRPQHRKRLEAIEKMMQKGSGS